MSLIMEIRQKPFIPRPFKVIQGHRNWHG